LNPIHFHNDRLAARLLAFLENLLFRLVPVLDVAAGDASGAEVDFFRAAADAFLKISKLGWRTHRALL
jgi:hypothetical protein